MKRINILDEHTSNKIAAGEVVERPSSVVKELIENSIDALSKNISVEIEEGGISLIKLIDDGQGIHPDDIEKAFMPHATSKIKSAEDIYNISTLGFRGEALPSIASVAKVSMRSRIVSEQFGEEVYIEGGKLIHRNETGMNEGTNIEVRDIFFNIPARKKFLKSASRESSIINDIVSREALSHPEVAFKLTSNGKTLTNTFGNGSLKDVIRSIYGKNTADNITYFSEMYNDIAVSGYIGSEEIAKGTRNNQSIFVNKRYIKNKTIVAAVENAFKSFSALNKFPFFVLMIEIDPESIDVNIHPTKSEIKFKDERAVFKIVFDAVHSALKVKANDIFLQEVMLHKDEDIIQPVNITFDDVTIVKEAIDEKVDIDYKPSVEVKVTNTYDYSKFEDNTLALSKSEVESEEKIYQSLKESFSTQKKSAFPTMKVIGQYAKTYILAEYNMDLYIIDQHAAHEKILYEKYYNQIKEQSIIIQPLLVPLVLDLALEEYSYYDDNKEVFFKAGFVIDEFGGNSILIKESPYFLGKIDNKNLFYDILMDLRKLGTGKTIDIKLNKIATMACKAAIKGNDIMDIKEMERLLEDLQYLDDPFHCPHGRPVIIKFTEYELEKKFRRII